eukprot:TRINITY_DN773095_c0_g1_i1.p1 TRINITY_DN773095_c0_g1~~TRINITY_DN773095_c0_g1_i1.p1  ORF type:complete len:291 (-),score=60.73 TRINITY_DN773095_c0_g1_i1:120-992(-)
MLPSRIHLDENAIVSWKFKANGRSYTLNGASAITERTAFVIPELSVCFDYAFPVTTRRPDIVLLSHTHGDHSSCLYLAKSRARPPKLVIPKESESLVHQFFKSAIMMTSHINITDVTDTDDMNYFNLVGVEPNDEFKHKNLNFKVIECFHGVPCRGYMISEIRKGLRDDLKGKTQKEIAQLARSGEIVSVATDFPIITFLGDTTTEVFKAHPEVLKSPVIVVECTSYDPEFKVDKRGHTHWDQLKPIAEDNPQCQFILTHFSDRFKGRDIVEFFQKEGLSNVMPWIQDDL